MATHQKFGERLREARIAKGYGLREFAKLVGVSPTYLSLIEQGNVDPPTAERATRITALLGENPDEWIVLAGRLPEDILEIIRQKPAEVLALIRTLRTS